MVKRSQPLRPGVPATQALQEIARDALTACDASRAVERAVWAGAGRVVIGGRTISLRRKGNLLVLAFGKASGAMTRGLLNRIAEAGGSRAVRCLVIGSERASRPKGRPRVLQETIRGDHPVPGRASFAAGRKALQFVSSLRPNDDLIFLASGGGSSMMASPLTPFLSSREKTSLHRALIVSGAPIGAINAIRRTFSAVKGGRLAGVARRARTQTTLVVCDVDPERFGEVASGPSLPDHGGREAAVLAIDRYGLAPLMPAAILNVLQTDRLPAAPGPGHPAFRRAAWESILSNRELREAAIRAGRSRGLDVESPVEGLTGPTDDAAGRLAEAIEKAPPHGRLLVLGGEVLTQPLGDGVGGRASELALCLAIRMSDRKSGPWAFLAFGSDGLDGNSPAAGAYADATTLHRSVAARLDVERALAGSDTHRFFRRIGDDFVTGPTGTNVRDLYLLLTGTQESSRSGHAGARKKQGRAGPGRRARPGRRVGSGRSVRPLTRGRRPSRRGSGSSRSR
ncbi:MAG: DUF4147 domain-containing protein [Acidobacteriota bacterium]